MLREIVQKMEVKKIQNQKKFWKSFEFVLLRVDMLRKSKISRNMGKLENLKLNIHHGNDIPLEFSEN